MTTAALSSAPRGGDGQEGEDITANPPTVRGLPLTIPLTGKQPAGLALAGAW